MYEVIKYFTDLQDNDFAYEAGDKFPREGLKVSKDRLAELSSEKNKRGIPLIKKVEDTTSSGDEESTDSQKKTTRRRRSK